MKKSQPSLLILFLLAIMTSCQMGLKEFQPEKESLFKITFSYPADWNWEEEIPFDDPPPFQDLPPSERIVLDSGWVSIQVYKPSDPQALMQEWLDAYSGTMATTLRDDTAIQIDGYDARWLTVLNATQDTKGTLISETIYLLANDRFYIIVLYVPESEIDGRLHAQFKELIKSIKVLQ